MQQDPVFQLSGTTLATIGGMIGVMSTAIAFLFKTLLAAKDELLESREQEIEQLRAERDLARGADWQAKFYQTAGEAAELRAQLRTLRRENDAMRKQLEDLGWQRP